MFPGLVGMAGVVGNFWRGPIAMAWQVWLGSSWLGTVGFDWQVGRDSERFRSFWSGLAGKAGSGKIGGARAAGMDGWGGVSTLCAVWQVWLVSNVHRGRVGFGRYGLTAR